MRAPVRSGTARRLGLRPPQFKVSQLSGWPVLPGVEEIQRQSADTLDYSHAEARDIHHAMLKAATTGMGYW